MTELRMTRVSYLVQRHDSFGGHWYQTEVFIVTGKLSRLPHMVMNYFEALNHLLTCVAHANFLCNS